MSFDRRTFLRGAGVTLALPWLESLPAAGPDGAPQRLVLIALPLGLYRPAFVPAGEDAAGPPTSEYLALLDDLRARATVVTGLEHPGVHGGHAAEPRLFTGQPTGRPNHSSLDQVLAGHLGEHTRFDSLSLGCGGDKSYSWTASGTAVPHETRAERVYARLFSDEAADAEEVLRRLRERRSLLDLLARQARDLQPRLSSVDRSKLEEYLTALRETERRLVKAERWARRPRPVPGVPPPVDVRNPENLVTQFRNLCDVTFLALKSDSTRVVTLDFFRQNRVLVDGVTNGYHPLSHHGQDPEHIVQLKRIEATFFRELRAFVERLRDAREGETSLLDRTTVLVTSPLGNASNHSNEDLPVLLLGGPYAHGRHLAFAPGTVPLANLFVTVLRRCGLEVDSFATSTGGLEGL